MNQEPQANATTKKRNAAIALVTLLVSWTIVAILCICILMLVRPVYNDSTLRSHVGTLNQTLWSLETQTDLLNDKFAAIADALVALGTNNQMADAMIFNSTERTRQALILLLMFLEQEYNAGRL